MSSCRSSKIRFANENGAITVFCMVDVKPAKNILGNGIGIFYGFKRFTLSLMTVSILFIFSNHC